MLLPLLLLAGCGTKRSNTQDALDFRTRLLEAGGCTFDAALTAQYGETAAQFSMHCAVSLEQGADMTLTAPETLRGITAHVDRSGAKLVFDGAEIGFPPLAGGRLAPMCAPWLLADGLAGGYIAWTGVEDGALRVTYLCGYGTDELALDVWFDGDVPSRAELGYDGQTLLCAELTNFTFEA